jgi:hypothetical protein
MKNDLGALAQGEFIVEYGAESTIRIYAEWVPTNFNLIKVASDISSAG